MNKIRSNSYKEAGVDIDLAGELLDKMKKNFRKARRPEMLAPIGGFGGLFQLDLKKYNDALDRIAIVNQCDNI